MSALEHTSYITPEQYLEAELKAETKSEYLNGNVIPMPPVSMNHVILMGNVLGELHFQLKGRPCEVFFSQLRLKVEATGFYTYPDVMALCGEIKVDSLNRDTITNPSVIVEVLSPSTEDYDKGRKFDQYRKIATLTDYLIVAQDRPWVLHWTRQQGGRWLLSETGDMESKVTLESIGCELPLSAIYSRVEFSESNTPASRNGS